MKTRYLVFILVTQLSEIKSSSADGGLKQQDESELREKIYLSEELKSNLVRNYKKTIPPRTASGGEAVVVNVDYELLGIPKPDMKDDTDAKVSIRLKWSDSRFKYDYKTINSTSITLPKDSVWLPRLKIQKSPYTSYENEFVHVTADGMVTFEMLVVTPARCVTSWTRFPRDSTLCKVAFASTQYFKDEVTFIHDMNKTSNFSSPHQDAPWHLRDVELRLSESGDDAPATPGFEIVFILNRNRQYYDVHLFVPITTITMVNTIATFVPWNLEHDVQWKVLSGLGCMITVALLPMTVDVPKTLHFNVVSNFTLAQLAQAVCTTLLYVIIVKYFEKLIRAATPMPSRLRRCLLMDAPKPPAAAPVATSLNDVGHDRYTNDTLKALAEIQDAIRETDEPSELELEWREARSRVLRFGLVILCMCNVAVVLALLLPSTIFDISKEDLEKMFKQ